ncbi:MAG: response regulator [Algoriphagus sp.]|uniref:response regulator n=1 Tax=Algoriphagus sp. TaxID=1872435 RepID=UPI0027317C0B|nr:response regulator [Algoriphagus sp.]MDP2041854.1 response regulator [Algoriphagus sp.]MDP3470935.1 response regulator [Algoriphagus sp.]
MKRKIQNLDCVLLIDDDEATNFYHTIVLEEQSPGMHIQSVSSAKEGLDFLLCKGAYAGLPQPGIIFLDINMPGMNGWDFLSKYEELSMDIHARSVVVMLSTSLNPDDQERAAKISIVKEFVHKPLTPEIFKRVVNENFN